MRAVTARLWRTTYDTSLASTRLATLTRKQQPTAWRRGLVFPAQAAESTIFALSTAPGRAAIALIRVSGPACLDVYKALCPDKAQPKPRYATLRTLSKPTDTGYDILDSDALVLYFPAPRTVTGEDVLELHLHGGTAVVKAVLSAISSCSGAKHSATKSIRYAEPGEFTKRAFLNNRLDLTQVEALGDTLSATTEQQRRLSVRGNTGVLARQYEDWRTQLLYARGELEALIDFSEDQHFDESPAELCASVSEQVTGLKRMLKVHSRNAVKGELLRDGINMSLLGAPNAGKSSLLNRIVGREAAIVSQEAGTTRDVVEIGLDIGGYFCRLGDTAGLRKDIRRDNSKSAREASDEATDLPSRFPNQIGQVEQEGMRRAKLRAAESDVVVVVLSIEDVDGGKGLYLDPEVLDTAKQLCSEKDNIIVIINKIDLLSSEREHQVVIQETLRAIPGLGESRVNLLSCKHDDSTSSNQRGPSQFPAQGNIQSFLSALIQHFGMLTAASTPDGVEDSSIWQESLGASERHRILLEQCIEALEAFLMEVCPSSDTLADEADIVVAAEHLRSAAQCLAKITGRGEAGDVEEVLGVVFEKFCVGK